MERGGGEKFRAGEGQLEGKTHEWLWAPRGQQEVSGKLGKGKATLTSYFIHSFVNVYWEHGACLASS